MNQTPVSMEVGHRAWRAEGSNLGVWALEACSGPSHCSGLGAGVTAPPAASGGSAESAGL